MNLQLALIDGYAVEHPAFTPGRPELTEAQRIILRHVGEHGFIRSSEAGDIVHECSRLAQRAAESGVLEAHLQRKRTYRATDGLEACKRLAERGLLVRVERGVWKSPNDGAELAA